jgi:hypothetical protein
MGCTGEKKAGSSQTLECLLGSREATHSNVGTIGATICAQSASIELSVPMPCPETGITKANKVLWPTFILKARSSCGTRAKVATGRERQLARPMMGRHRLHIAPWVLAQPENDTEVFQRRGGTQLMKSGGVTWKLCPSVLSQTNAGGFNGTSGVSSESKASSLTELTRIGGTIWASLPDNAPDLTNMGNANASADLGFGVALAWHSGWPPRSNRNVNNVGCLMGCDSMIHRCRCAQPVAFQHTLQHELPHPCVWENQPS